MIETESSRSSNRQSVEQALRESELKWRQLAETAPDFIISISPDRKILFMNRPITSKTTDEVIGKDALQFVAPDHESTFINALDKVFRTATPTEYEILSIGADKTKPPAWYSTKIAPVIIDGKVVSATLITRNITDRKIMEEELRQARDLLETKVQERTAEIQKALSLLEATFESSPNALMVMDFNRKVIRFNKNFEKMWNFPKEIMDSRDATKMVEYVSNLVINMDVVRKMTAALQAEPMAKRTDILQLKDGRKIERTTVPQLLENASIGRVFTYQDVTVRENHIEQEHHARLEAEKSVKMRDDFLAMASHELRTPLTPLKMYLDWFKREARKITKEMLPKAEVLKQALDHTEREVSKLVHLTDDLLDVSRITAGRLVLNKQPMDLVELVVKAEQRNLENSQRRNCTISLSTYGPVKGVWDVNRLEQVFNCLLSNATKYGAGKPVHITVRKENNLALLQVEDKGIGIAPEDQEKIFQKFERASSINNYDGLGLGLFISNEIVQAHGGTIKVESELGKGSVFTVSLPIEEIK